MFLSTVVLFGVILFAGLVVLAVRVVRKVTALFRLNLDGR
jgi:hypothetical protein